MSIEALPSLIALLLAGLMAIGGAVSGQRQREEAAALNERLAGVLGNGQRHDAAQPILGSFTEALERLSDEATKRQGEAENERKARAELYKELWELRDLLADFQRDARVERAKAEDDRERAKLEQDALRKRIEELEVIAAQVPKLTDERDRAVKTAEAAKKEADELRGRVEELEREVAQLKAQQGGTA